MKLLVGWGVLTAITYIILDQLSVDAKNRLDPYIVGLIGGTLLAAAVMMLVFTKTWTTRALGVMGTAFGCAALYLGALILYAFPGTAGLFDEISDTARAFLIVGGPMFAFGITAWARQYFMSRSGSEEAL